MDSPTSNTRRSIVGSLREPAYAMVLLLGTWYMLGELKSVMRPLLLAVFMGYVLLPTYTKLRKRWPVPLAMGLLVGGTSLILVGITAAVTGSLVDLTEQAPALKSRAVFLIHSLGEWIATLPFVGPAQAGAKPLETQIAEVATENGLKLVSLVALGIPEALAAGLYLLFLFIEAGKFPARVRRVYRSEQAEELLDIFGHINSAVVSYLKAKVNSSLVLAIPVFFLLWLLGVKFAILWAVLTFVCNFIPYLGSVVAWSLPAGFAFLQWDGTTTPIVVASLLLVWHGTNAAIIEPMIVGRAVGLSPLVILLALSLWGLLWGIPGMFMAVPLTVVGRIILENVPFTRQMALLTSEDTTEKPD